jgi:hypothetical protein
MDEANRNKVRRAVELLREAWNSQGITQADPSDPLRRAVDWAEDSLEPPLTDLEEATWAEVSGTLWSEVDWDTWQGTVTKREIRDYIEDFVPEEERAQSRREVADRVDGYDRDDLGESPDY